LNSTFNTTYICNFIDRRADVSRPTVGADGFKTRSLWIVVGLPDTPIPPEDAAYCTMVSTQAMLDDLDVRYFVQLCEMMG